jgi:FixJ family two-component response regulator
MPTQTNDKLRRSRGSQGSSRPDHEANRLLGHIVYVIDDDPDVREAVGDLLASCQYNALTFASAAEYIGSPKPLLAGCLVLDIELPDINGLDLQRQLAGESHPPIVFITGHGDIPSSVRAMKDGAVDFLSKPFSEQELLAAVDCALEQDRKARALQAELEQLRARYATLTPRERETLPLMVSGLRNKQAAAVLGISLVTMQIHRANIVRKMQAASLSDLVRMCEKLQIPQQTLMGPPCSPSRNKDNLK